MHPAFDGVLFFPVTPFTESGSTSPTGSTRGPGGVFIACGTGEFHAPEASDRQHRAHAVDVVGGWVPVYAGAGRSIRQQAFARVAAEAGVVGRCSSAVSRRGAAGRPVDYTRAVAQVTDLSVIVYNRNNARYTEASAIEVAQIENVVGFKDGTGDLDQVSRIVRAVTDSLAPTGKPFQFFNGLPTAEGWCTWPPRRRT